MNVQTGLLPILVTSLRFVSQNMIGGPRRSNEEGQMQHQDARYILREITISNYRDFLENQLSVRHAYNAAISITHMVDHICDGIKGKVGNKQRYVEERSNPFKHVAAMCNAIKHVRAFRGGSKEAVATVQDVAVADSTTVLFTDEIDGSLKSFRPESEILIFVYNDNGMLRNIWVGVELFCALLFVAKELNCEGLVYAAGLPDEVNLVYGDCGGPVS